MSALEVIESHSQSSDFTVHDLAQATAALRRALDLEIALQGWKERVGVDPTRIDVARVQNHRQWVAVARGLSPIMGNWLVATDTTRRCQIVIGLEAKLTALKNAMSRTQDSLASFGHLRGDGPFAILSMTGTSREIEQRCNAFTEKVFLLPSYAALLREGETAKKLGITNLIKRAEGREVSTNLLIDTFRGAVAYQQAKAIWEADDELRYFQSDAH